MLLSDSIELKAVGKEVSSRLLQLSRSCTNSTMAPVLFHGKLFNLKSSYGYLGEETNIVPMYSLCVPTDNIPTDNICSYDGGRDWLSTSTLLCSCAVLDDAGPELVKLFVVSCPYHFFVLVSLCSGRRLLQLSFAASVLTRHSMQARSLVRRRQNLLIVVISQKTTQQPPWQPRSETTFVWEHHWLRCT